MSKDILTYRTLFRLSVFVNTLGLILFFIGLASPWSSQNPTPGFFSGLDVRDGLSFQIGTYALVAWLIALLFQWLTVTRNRKFAFVVMCCGVAMSACSVVYILRPYASIEYGVYLSLAGGLIIVASSIIGFLMRHLD